MDRTEKNRELQRYHKAVAGFHTDGYRNMLNKVGTAQDNSTAWDYWGEYGESDMQMASLYETNGLFSKIINRPAEDALAKGIDLSDLGKEFEDEVNKRLTHLHFTDKMVTAEKWSRLFGGAIAVLLVDDGRGIDEPLNMKAVKSIEDIRVFERAIVQPDYSTLYSYSYYDFDNERDIPWGQPEYYYVYSTYGQFKVHYTRCLIFKNGQLPEYTSSGFYRFFGVPEYLRVRDFMREVINSHHDGAKLLERSVLGIYKMKNLSTLLATDEGENQVIQRLQVIDMARNIINSMAIDADGEDYSYINASMAGASDLIDRTANMLSAVTDIPQTILFGKSPSGMDATGDNDMENYYQLLARIQANDLKDNTEKVVQLVLLQLWREGRLDGELPAYEVRFVPYKQMTEAEQATIDQQKAATEQVKAATAQAYVDMQALDPSEVRKGLAQSDVYEIQDLVDEDNLELPADTFEQPQGMPQGAPGMNPGAEQNPEGRMDADDDLNWVTINGQHVPISKATGETVGGNPKVFGEKSMQSVKAKATEAQKTAGKVAEETPVYKTTKKGTEQPKSVAQTVKTSSRMTKEEIDSAKSSFSQEEKGLYDKAHADSDKAIKNLDETYQKNIDDWDRAKKAMERGEQPVTGMAMKKDHVIPGASKEAQEIYQKIASQEPEISKDMCEIAMENGGQMYGLAYSCKTGKSMRSKIERKKKEKRDQGLPEPSEEEIVSGLGDIVRYTQLCEHDKIAETTQKTVDKLKKKGYDVIELENKWLDQDKAYKGVHIGAVSPGGVTIELQIHSEQSMRVKETIHPMEDVAREATTPDGVKGVLRAEMWPHSDAMRMPADIEKVSGWKKKKGEK